MKFTVYKTTNLVNNNIYIGAHKQKDDEPDDRYIGTGRVLKAAIKKYGRENFTKEILFTFSSSDEMYEKERELVTEKFVAREDTYNVQRGGKGGENHPKPVGHGEAISKARKGMKFSEEHRQRLSEAAKKRKKPSRLGKLHTAETKQKLREASIRQQNDPEYKRRHSEGCSVGQQNRWDRIKNG